MASCLRISTATRLYDLEDLLVNNWGEVPAALTWATYTPATQTWADAENTGLGEIDRPGNYELASIVDPIRQSLGIW
jgi:hypothetical protein